MEKPRKVWCSQACSDEWGRRLDAQGTCRAICRDRDRGVCGSCKIDTTSIRAEIRRASLGLVEEILTTRGINTPASRSFPPGDVVREARERLPETTVIKVALLLGFTLKDLTSGRSLFEADHRVEIADGGEWFDPYNLVTICLPCHRKKSASNATRRAAERRAARKIFQP